MHHEIAIGVLREIESRSLGENRRIRHPAIPEVEIKGKEYWCKTHPNLRMNRGSCRQHIEGKLHVIDFYQGITIRKADPALRYITGLDELPLTDPLGRKLSFTDYVNASILSYKSPVLKEPIPELVYYKHHRKIKEMELEYLEQLIELDKGNRDPNFS